MVRFVLLAFSLLTPALAVPQTPGVATGRQVIGVPLPAQSVRGPAGAGTLADHVSGWVNVRSYATSDAPTGANLAAAASAAATAGRGLLIAHPVTISTAVGTIAVPVRFEGGGRLILAAGGSVTLSGALDAPLTQIFDVQGGSLTFNAKVSAVYPQWWGAKGDGVSDDTGALQAALDAARTSGGGTVLVPPGTYIIAPPGALSHITIGSNVTVQGSGDASVLKVKSGAGNYRTVFGPYPDYSATVSNVTLRDFKVDQNASASGADVATANADQSHSLFVIYFTKFSNVLVDNVTFDPISGVNTVAISGSPGTYRGATVKNCRFRYVQGPTTSPGYDNTTVYLYGHGIRAEGNRFYAAIGDRARGAIELHGASGVAIGNVSDGYASVVRLVTPNGPDPAVASNDFTVTGNTARNASDPINLWSATGHTLRNATIVGNTLQVANATWTGVNSNPGINLNRDASGGLDGDFEGLVIEGNTILYDRQNGVVDGSTNSAIGLAPQGNVSNVTVRGNIIRNAPSSGIRVTTWKAGTQAKNIAILHNQLVDVGNDTSGGGYRAGIILGGKCTDVEIAGNSLVDTGVTFLGASGINASPSAGSARVYVHDNVLSVADSSQRYSMTLAGTGVSLRPDTRVVNLTYFATVNIGNATDGGEYVIAATDANAFTIGAPWFGTPGQRIRVKIKNVTAGALGAATWNAVFKLATWTQPGAGTHRSIEFVYDGASWDEVARSGDVPN